MQQVSASIFRSWLCVSYNVSPDGTEERSYLRGDFSVRCTSEGHVSDTHQAIIRIASVLVAVWPVGFVLVYVAALLPCRTPIAKHTFTPLVHATRFLHRE